MIFPTGPDFDDAPPWVWGVAAPVLMVGYGVVCLVTQQANFGRYRLFSHNTVNLTDARAAVFG